MKGYRMDQLSLHSRKLLLEAVCSAEDAAIQLRQYAAATLPPVREIPEISGDIDLPASIEVTVEGWLRIELPCVMPRREDNDRSRFLAGLLRNAIHRAFPKHDQPRFYTCVLVYEHIYDLSRSMRFIDHDNLELKHCQDVLEAAFLTNDTSELCSAFQCSHREAQDSTRIWILTPEQFPEWLKRRRECWNGSTENI